MKITSKGAQIFSMFAHYFYLLGKKKFENRTYGFPRIDVNLTDTFDNMQNWSTSVIFFTMKMLSNHFKIYTIVAPALYLFNKKKIMIIQQELHSLLT